MNHPRLLTLLALCLALPLTARADRDDDDDDDDRGGKQSSRVSTAAAHTSPQWKSYATECGSCHLAYPPSMLPARSWKALMAGLNDHFGQNAEVDATVRKQLETFLVQNAGRDVPGATPLRITALPWWRHEHDEIPASTYQRKAITSPANCGACHPGANEGAFGEHAVKVPRDAPAPR
jgi:predicted CxxxxCH...CXXCH cytochrome family protein